MRKAFVLFDLGETLVDLKELLASLARQLSSRFPPLRASAGDLVRRWIIDSSRRMPRQPGDPFVPEFGIASEVMSQLLQAQGIAIGAPGAGVILRAGWDDFEMRVRFVRGVTEKWLMEIRSLSSGMAIVTDGDRENVNRLLRRLPLSKYFDVIVTSEEVRGYKPNPAIYQAALRSLHAPAEESLFVSDSALDLRGAAALGMATCLLGQRFIDPSTVLPQGSLVVPDPQDLIAVLRGFVATSQFKWPTP